MFTQVPLNRILPKRQNVRTTFDGIDELAETIHAYGLLQNLVVEPAGDRWMIQAGERRFRALCLLTTQNRPWNPGPDGVTQVPVLVRTSADFDWVNALENLQRREVPVWQMGRRFAELTDAGFRQVDIANKYGITQGKVSRYIIIATNIAPAVIARLEQIPSYAWKDHDLTRLANIVTKYGDPDAPSQLKYLEELLADPHTHAKHRKRTRGMALGSDLIKTVYNRYKNLKKGRATGKMTSDDKRVIDAVVRYLEGVDGSLRL